jgi:DNA repair protein RadC
MRDYSDVTTIYTKTLRTVRLKISEDYVADSGPEKPTAENPNEVYEILKAIYRQLDDDQEHMVMVVLNLSNQVVGYKVISSGSQASSPGDSKIIFRNALLLGAAKIILAHNHPSGQQEPSEQDIKFTEKVIQAGQVVDIPLVDHLILTHRGYISMRTGDYCKFEPFV